MRARTNITLKDRLQMQLQDFKGVDFSSSPLRVQSNRASNSVNFINEYGVNKKRNGWNQLYQIPNVTVDGESVPQKINGIFPYSHGTHNVTIVHARSRFYKVTYASGVYTTTAISVSGILDQRSQAFYNKGKLYIIGCGDFLVYGTWDGTNYELRRVVDNAYIPTTTISIDDDNVESDIRASLDDVNMLSRKRKNQLLGISQYFRSRDVRYQVGKTYYTHNDDNTYSVYTHTVNEEVADNIYEQRADVNSGTWTLDTDIDLNTNVSITLEVMESGVLATYLIQNNNTDKTKLYKTHKDGTAITRVECGSIVYATGKITLNCPTEPPIENRDNIIVTFEHLVEGYSDRVTKCTFGTLFGVGGNTDRLFLSGNADYPNIDFHSEADDYTYFGDMESASMGSDASAINGYARLSDSTLVIFKEPNGQEANIYYRTGKYNETYDGDTLSSFKGVFSTTAGNIGEGIISRHACANFGGDNLMLSPNGIYGIVLANNVATAERYTRERSRSINEKLKNHNLAEAVGIVHKDKYYLSVDGVCYVADSRFKYASDDSYNYEWWYWENIPARVWASIDNKLYFGTADGRVCVFDDKYTDRTYTTSNRGDLSINFANSTITYNSNIGVDIARNDKVKFNGSDFYSLYLDTAVVENGKIKVTPNEIDSIYENTKVYADNFGDSGLIYYQQYTVCNVNTDDCTFQLLDQEDNVVVLGCGGFRLLKNISGKEMLIAEISEESFQLKEYELGSPIQLATRSGGSLPAEPTATFTHYANVVAKWYTPIFDFGTNESSKTLLKMTISTEPSVNGKISFGYETKRVSNLINAKGINTFTLDNLSFENFSFDTDFASSYSVKIKERNFNFIIFRFISDNAYNCAINNFTVLYKINKSNKGVN